MKHKWLFAGASIALFTSALVFATLGANNVIFKFNDTKDTASASSTFDIDYESFSDPSNHISQAIAISESGYTFNFQFVGFEKDQYGYMYLPHGTVGWFTNTERLDLGFDDLRVSFEFEDPTQVNYTYASYFSYYPLNLTNIMSGIGNQDLVCESIRSSTDSRSIEYRANPYNIRPALMANSRYTLFWIEALEQDLYLYDMSFSTPCSTPAVSPGAETDYTDYLDSEKSSLNNFSLSSLPFVGNGSYNFKDDYDIINISGVGCVNNYKSTLISFLTQNGFHYAAEIYNYSAYQKVVAQDRVITVGILFDESNFHYPYYDISIIDNYPLLITRTSWPSDDISEFFSSDFANVLNTYGIDDQALDATYQLSTMAYNFYNQMEMILEFDNQLTHEQICNYIHNAFFGTIDSNVAGYSIVANSSPYYDSYCRLENSDGTKVVTFESRQMTMEDDYDYMLTVKEIKVFDHYPMAELSNQLNINQNLLGNYISSQGSTYAAMDGLSITIRNNNYNTIVAEVNNYINSLKTNNGYEVIEEGLNYIRLGSNPFDGVEIHITFYNDSIIIRTSKYNYDRFNSIEDAVNRIYKEFELITAHIFPELSEGEHEITIGNSLHRQSIYVSNCTNSDVAAMLSGGIYDYYSDSYLLDESTESRQLGIRAKLDVNSNLVLSLVEVHKEELERVMTSAQANDLIDEYFGNDYVDLPNSGSEKVYFYDYGSICFLDDSYYEDYIDDITSNGYVYYEFSGVYYNSSTNGLLSFGSYINEYGQSVHRVGFSSSENEPVDFKNYAAYSSELSTINSDYGIIVPTTGYKYIMIDGSRIITDTRSEDGIEQSLLNNGYISSSADSGLLFEKYDGTYYYRVKYSDYCDDYEYRFLIDSGYALYEFEKISDYFVNYSTFTSSLTSVDQNLVDALPDLSGNGNALFIHNGVINEHSLDFEVLNTVVSEQSLRTKLENNGYTAIGENSYIYSGENCSITCYISRTSLLTHLYFNQTVYNWRSMLDLGKDPFTFAYGYTDYIARLNVAGEIYSVIFNSDISFSFYLKTNSITDYADNLYGLGYEITKSFDENGGSASLYDKMKGLYIDCNVAKISNGVYRVSYQYSVDGYNFISSGRLNLALQTNGLSNTELFTRLFSIYYMSGWFNKDSESSCSIGMFNVKELEGQLESNGYTKDGENSIYTKEDSNYTYEISINGEDVIITVTAKTPNP